MNICKCDICGKEICNGDPHIEINYKIHFCWKCAFKCKQITEAEFLSCSGIDVKNLNSSKTNGVSRKFSKNCKQILEEE